jgi:nucleotide-binding universal stress UspA family protein
MKTRNSILVATDFSPASEAAVREGIRIADALGARLTLFHCYLEPAGAFAVESVERYETLMRAVRSDAVKKLEELSSGAVARRIPVEFRLAMGRPDREIVRAAFREGARLIVLGTHGQGGRRALVGSVARRVVAGTGRPVLTVPPNWRAVEDREPLARARTRELSGAGNAGGAP